MSTQSKMGRNPFDRGPRVLKTSKTADFVDRSDTPQLDESSPPRNPRIAARGMLFKLTFGVPIGITLLSIKSVLLVRYLAKEMAHKLRS